MLFKIAALGYHIPLIYMYLFIRKLQFQKLIRRYYHQVTNGCGNANCVNKACAQNRHTPVGSDEGAAIALQLFKERAKLCVEELPKVVKKQPKVPGKV